VDVALFNRLGHDLVNTLDDVVRECKRIM
jgi:hypothetical protein